MRRNNLQAFHVEL